jgi:hypothetical protein
VVSRQGARWRIIVYDALRMALVRDARDEITMPTVMKQAQSKWIVTVVIREDNKHAVSTRRQHVSATT